MTVFPGDQVWTLKATHGFPIADSFALLADMGMAPSMVPLIRAALKDRVNPDNLMSELEEAYRTGAAPEVAQYALALYPGTPLTRLQMAFMFATCPRRP